MEMLLVMAIITMAYAMILPRLSFDSRGQKLPHLIIALQQAQADAKLKAANIVVYAKKQAIIIKSEQKQIDLKAKVPEKWEFPGIAITDDSTEHLLTIMSPDGTMKPAEISYQCGNNHYTIKLTAFNGIKYEGAITDDEPVEACSTREI